MDTCTVRREVLHVRYRFVVLYVVPTVSAAPLIFCCAAPGRITRKKICEYSRATLKCWLVGSSTMVGREDEDYPDEMEERLINEEYKIWKKNTPFLYGE